MYGQYSSAFTCDEDLAAAVFCRVVGAPVPVDTPVALEGRGDALGARREGVAVKEGEVGRHKVGAVGHPDRQDGGQVVLVRWDQRQQVVPRRGAADPVGATSRVSRQCLAQHLENALELARQGWQVVDRQRQGPRRCPLKLVRMHAGDGCAPER